MNNSKRIYRAAIYVRLSKEDGDLDDVRKAESNSISNQKSLILNYLKDKEDIEIVSIREDDGYSGATFDRPAFKLMLQDVKDGIIDCIVVKDLSRFAREYIDAGRYIERMFPAMGIRFIAINDAYDSADTQAQGNEIIIPFKNLINDAYMWDNSEVIAIVQNEQYKGIMIQNKCETVGFGDNKKVRKRNKEDWSVVEGAIPRIVSDEMFDEVNKMLRVEARGIEKSTKKRKKNLFICPYCGRKLMNSSAVCTPKLLCPKRRMVRTGECQQIFMLKSEAQDKVLEITKEICRTLIQEEELKKASKDKRKVTSDEYLISELKAEYDRISNSTVSCYQSYREGKYTKEEYVQLRKTNQELLADLENQISDLQEKAANQEPDTEEKIEQLTQYSMLEQYDGDVLSNIIDKVLIYNDKDIEVVFKGENFIRNAV